MTPAAHKVLGALAVVFDEPSDLQKFAYNPAHVGHQATNDFVASSMNDAFGVGVSGHVVASIVSKVLVKAIAYAKKKLAGGTTEDTDAGLMEVAELISSIYAKAFKELGIKGKVPPAEGIAEVLRSLLNG